MKKFLLPIVGLLLGGAAAQAEEVTCTYWSLVIPEGTEWGSDDYYYRQTEEIFLPTTNELVDNEDGTYLLKNYQNSGYDLKFKIENDFLSFPDLATGMRLLKDAAGNTYQFKLTTAQKYPSFVAGESINYETSAGIYSYATAATNTYRINYLTLKNETKTATEVVKTYDVRIGTVWYNYKVPNGEKDPGSDPVADQLVSRTVNPGAVVFELTVSEPREGADIAYQTASGSELFQTSKSPVTQNEDGSVKLEYFANSDAAFTFSIDAANIADGKAPLVFTEGVSTADPDSYQTLAGATFSLQTTAGATKTGALAVKPSGCYAAPIDGTATLVSQKYTVYIDAKFGDEVGYAVFEAEGVPAVTPEGVVTMIYRTYSSYGLGTEIEQVPAQVIKGDDNTLLVKNFLNSGYDIPFVLSDKTEVDGKDYYAEGTAKPKEDYIDSDNGSYVRIKIPENPTLEFTAVVAGTNVVNPGIYYTPNNGYVRYYKENGKIRTQIYATFGAPWYTVEWNMYEDDAESGIQDVVVDENAPVEWFNLQGVRVNGENLTPGIYIKRQGSKAVKVLVR